MRLMAMHIFALIAIAVAFSSAVGQERLPIGIVNVDRILKSHKPLVAKVDPLKAEAKELEAAVQVRQAELETVLGQFRRAQPGSPEQQRLQGQIGKLQTDMQQFVVGERTQLQKKEMTVYLEFFRQLDAEISKYAKEHGLKLVLRQSETSLEDNQTLPETMKALNRIILYEEGLDITDHILQALGASPASAATER
jgi:Skp family chaperone for outer membrane proteins